MRRKDPQTQHNRPGLNKEQTTEANYIVMAVDLFWQFLKFRFRKPEFFKSIKFHLILFEIQVSKSGSFKNDQVLVKTVESVQTQENFHTFYVDIDFGK